MLNCINFIKPAITDSSKSSPVASNPIAKNVMNKNILTEDKFELSQKSGVTASESVAQPEKVSAETKTGMLSNELNFIKNPKIKDITSSLVEKLPDYFFSVPASSSGKYHPAYGLGEGGLVRHTKAAVGIAQDLFRMDEYNFTDDDKDLVTAALILHDGFKYGEEDNHTTLSNHPVIVADFINKNVEDKDIATKMSDLALTHMGQWNKDYKTGEEVMPKPQTGMQKLVHLCDYLASRKSLEYNFDVKR